MNRRRQTKNRPKKKAGTSIPDKVEAHFDRKYREFDAFYNEKKSAFARIIDAVFRRSMKLRFDKVMLGVSPYENKTVLDVGCGTGRYCITLALKGIKKAVGIDFAENMIAASRDYARQAKVEHICRFERADFMHLNMNGLAEIDHVFAMGVMDYVEQPADFVTKMVRLAGKNVMISFPASGGIIQRLRRHYFQKVKKCPIFFYSEAEVRQIAQRTGFEYRVERLAKDYFLTIHKST